MPISYRLDSGALKEGHVTGLTPKETSRNFAWDMGPSDINTNITITWKSLTLTQSTSTSKELLGT